MKDKVQILVLGNCRDKEDVNHSKEIVNLLNEKDYINAYAVYNQFDSILKEGKDNIVDNFFELLLKDIEQADCLICMTSSIPERDMSRIGEVNLYATELFFLMGYAWSLGVPSVLFSDNKTDLCLEEPSLRKVMHSVLTSMESLKEYDFRELKVKFDEAPTEIRKVGALK